MKKLLIIVIALLGGCIFIFGDYNHVDDDSTAEVDLRKAMSVDNVTAPDELPE